MQLVRRPRDRDAVYRLSLVTMKAFLALGLTLTAVHLAAPLLGGELLVNAVIKYTSWVTTAALGVRFVKRARGGLQIRGREYLLIGLTTIAGLMLSIPYPISIVVSIIAVAVFILAYQRRPRGREAS